MAKDFKDVFPLNSIRGNYLSNYAGDLTIGFELKYPSVFSIGKEQYERLHVELKSLLNNFRNECSFHQQDFYWYEPFQSLIETESFTRRKDFEYFMGKPQLKHRSFVFVSFPTFRTNYIAERNGSTLINGLGSLLSGDKFKDLDSKLESIKVEIGGIENALKSIDNVSAVRCDEKALVEVVYNYLSGTFDKWVSYDNIKGALDPMAIEEDHLKIGNQYIGVVSLSEQSASTVNVDVVNTLKVKDYNLGFDFSNDFGLPTSPCYAIGIAHPIKHVVNTIIEPRSKNDIDLLFTKEGKDIKLVIGMGWMPGFDGAKANLKKDALDYYLQQISTGEKRPVFLKQNIILYSNSIEEHRFHCDVSLRAYEKVMESRAIIENKQVANLFMGSLAGNSKDNFNKLISFLGESLCYLPSETLIDSGNVGHRVIDRFGNIFHFDFNNKNLVTAGHKVIFGPTGTGKSFFLNFYMSQAHNLNYSSVILDVGGSYRNLTNLLNGIYIDCGDKKNQRFNIFSCPLDAKHRYLYSLPEKDIDKVTSVFVILKKLLEGAAYNDNILRDSIISYYEHINGQISKSGSFLPMTLNGYVLFLKFWIENVMEEGFKRFIDFDSIRVSLKPFISGGEFEHLLNSDDSIDIASNRLVVFDVKGVQGNPKISSIVQMIICDIVLAKLGSLPLGQRKAFILEEAVDFLSGGEEVAEITSGLYRKGRKQNIEVVLCTQDAKFLNSCPALVKDSILSNAQTKIVLGFNSEDSKIDARRLLSLTDEHIYAIDNLKKADDDSWREVFILVNAMVLIIRVHVSPTTATAFSTSPKDLEMVNYYNEKYKSYETSIEKRTEDKRNGKA